MLAKLPCTLQTSHKTSFFLLSDARRPNFGFQLLGQAAETHGSAGALSCSTVHLALQSAALRHAFADLFG